MTEDDLGILLEHRNQWQTRRWLENCKILTMEDQKRWLATASRFARIVMDGRAPVGLARIALDGMDTYSVGGDVFAFYRGRGYGHAVFGACCLKAQDYGARALSLWVFVENVAAVKVYKKAGFQWDHSAQVKHFYRPDSEFGDPRVWAYARMTKAL